MSETYYGALPAAGYTRDGRQGHVARWCAAAFGAEHAQNVTQRAVRLAEEAIEAAQACGADPAMLHRLIDHVYEKPPGVIRQELGGVGVTLLALAAACDLSADEAEVAEINRVLSKPLEHFRARNAAKNAAGFDVSQGWIQDVNMVAPIKDETR